MMKKIVCFLVILVCFAAVTASAGMIRCASTTSTQNSGLFDYLLPIFTKQSGIEVQVVAVGTGAALALGKRGDVDVVFVHAKDTELKMVEEGRFIERRDVMYNDFVVVGPAGDPAGLRKVATVSDAFARIAEGLAPFISRGDDSGTHKKERKLWRTAGEAPDAARDAWYLSVGQGMAKTLRIAGEKQGYTLADRGTWLALKDRDRLNLAIVFEKDPALFNQYGVMLVNPAKHPHIKVNEARQFARWLVSRQGQEAIDSYRDSKGNRLFIANAQ